jgi:ribulose 1,5-bisphosphate synthetase/thiazole synthase
MQQSYSKDKVDKIAALEYTHHTSMVKISEQPPLLGGGGWGGGGGVQIFVMLYEMEKRRTFRVLWGHQHI